MADVVITHNGQIEEAIASALERVPLHTLVAGRQVAVKRCSRSDVKALVELLVLRFIEHVGRKRDERVRVVNDANLYLSLNREVVVSFDCVKPLDRYKCSDRSHVAVSTSGERAPIIDSCPVFRAGASRLRVDLHVHLQLAKQPPSVCLSRLIPF